MKDIVYIPEKVIKGYGLLIVVFLEKQINGVRIRMTEQGGKKNTVGMHGNDDCHVH